MLEGFELDPLTGDPIPKRMDSVYSTHSTVVIEPHELDNVQKLSHAELVALVQRMARQCGLVALMTPEQSTQAIIDRCTEKALNRDVKEFLPYAKESLDRMKGKAAQSIALTVEDKGLTGLTTDKLLALESQMAVLLGEPVLVIPPMPDKLGTDFGLGWLLTSSHPP